ncbi:MAG: hypothetical protein ACHREM_09500 [Polyangiales bacterium]
MDTLETEEREDETSPAARGDDDDLSPCPGEPCPKTGCAVLGTGKAMSNQLKRRLIQAELKDALPLPFAVFHELQQAAGARIPEGMYPPAADRGKLHDLQIGTRKLSEGDVVRVAGYLRVVRREGPESVNCKLSGASFNDIHLNVVEHAGDDEFSGFVAEVIPQERPKALEEPPLSKLMSDGVQVLIVGPLFYDTKHFVNAGPTAIPKQPKRFTLWEIHPISQIYTCPGGGCDARRSDGWQRLQ